MIKEAKDKENLNKIHVGQLLKSYIDKHRIYKSVLARKINKFDSTIIYYQKNASIQTAVLLELSQVLQHNFFADIAAQLPTNYTTNAPIDNTKDERIAQLTQENALLKAQNQVLVEIAKR